jgi:APA family basic amino acid/polyamine antiporter
MHPQSELRRQIGLTAAAALIVGEVIGIGIFLTPAEMARELASPLLLLIVWLVMGAMTLCGALCYGELAARFPEAGGGYVYLREAFGRPMAFIYGWVSMLVIDPGITAALAVGLAAQCSSLVPLSPIGQKLLAIAVVGSLAIVNALGVRLGTGVLRALTALKLGFLAFLVAWGFGRGLGGWDHFIPVVDRRPDAPALIGALAGGFVSAFFSFGGWWDVSKVAGEVTDPRRTMPRALVAGVALVTVVYILVSAVFLYLVPPANITSDDAFATLAGDALFGSSGGKVFAGIVILVVLGSLCSILLSQPRVYFAMARDGLFVPALARIHPRFGTPLRAIALQAVLSSVLVFWGSFGQILGYFLFAAVLLIAMSVAALFVFRSRPAPADDLPWSGHPFTTSFYLLLSVLLLALMALNNPVGAGIGVAIGVVGVFAYDYLPGGASLAADDLGKSTKNRDETA